MCTVCPAARSVVGERADAGGQPLGVVEQQDLGHGNLRMSPYVVIETLPDVAGRCRPRIFACVQDSGWQHRDPVPG